MLRNIARGVYEAYLERKLSSTDVPRHVAVVQDGNRRYARSKGEEPEEGHADGAETTEDVLDWAYEAGVEELTLYAFSTENFERADDELERLFDIIAERLDELADSDEVHERRVRVRGVGDIERLPERVRDAVEGVEEATRGYDARRVNIALAYGGREELVEAARRLARDVEEGILSPESVSASAVESRLRLSSDVDLLVRTGGERRTSNFLPWQARGAGAQVYFCDSYWPGFERHEFLKALLAYTDGGGAGANSEALAPAAVEEPAD
jgi:tritrans,polycis-undecaprenyl-diphosphate synthase [geranylgeranyl-diphosphate specific]